MAGERSEAKVGERSEPWQDCGGGKGGEGKEGRGERTNIDWEKIELSISLYFPFFKFLQNFKKNSYHTAPA